MCNAMVMLLLWFTIALGARPATLAAPSRKPQPGCAWKRFDADALAMSLWYEDCAAPNAHYELSVRNRRLEMHRPSDDVTYNGPYIAEVFSKSATETIERAIERQFISKLPKNADTRHCKAIRDVKTSKSLGPDKVVLVIGLDHAYEKKYVARFKDEIPPRACGDFGEDYDSSRYFEYHPSESQTSFLFVEAGQDEAVFDASSFRFW